MGIRIITTILQVGSIILTKLMTKRRPNVSFVIGPNFVAKKGHGIGFTPFGFTLHSILF